MRVYARIRDFDEDIIYEIEQKFKELAEEGSVRVVLDKDSNIFMVLAAIDREHYENIRIDLMKISTKIFYCSYQILM